MSILKKSLSFCLSGVMAALLPITTTANCVSPQIPTDSGYTSILDNNKNFVLPKTCIYQRENHELAEKYNNRVMVYDIYVKIDTADYVLNDPNLESVETVMDEVIKSFSAEYKNPDGSMVKAQVLDFEQKQVDKFTVLYPRNGVYNLSFIVSTGNNVYSTRTINQVNESPDPSDETPPQIRLTARSKSLYKPGDKVTMFVDTSEICTIQMGDKIYEDCNYATFDIPCNGKYGFTATDANGNTYTKYATIDYMVDINATTTKPTTTTTKPTTTTTTTTTQPATTTTTTTTQPTTTTTTTTTQPATTTTTTTTQPATTTTTTTTQPTTTTTTTTQPATTTTTTTTTQPATTTTTTNPPTTGEMPIYVCGDVNNDNKVSIADAAAILQYIGNPDKYGLSETGMLAADVVGNGNGVTVDDAIAIQKLDAKIINDFSELQY